MVNININVTNPSANGQTKFTNLKKLHLLLSIPR